MVAEWAKALTQIQVEAHQRSQVQIQGAFFIVFDHVTACASMHSLVKIRVRVANTMCGSK